MASSMTQQSLACTVKSVKKGIYTKSDGTAGTYTLVCARIAVGTGNSNIKNVGLVAGAGVTSDFSFILTGGTVPAAADTFNLVLN